MFSGDPVLGRDLQEFEGTQRLRRIAILSKSKVVEIRIGAEFHMKIIDADPQVSNHRA
jgi:hypothetical protein